MFSHPFKTVRRAGSPSAGGNALSMETHIASTSAHPQYQKKGDAASNVDLSAHIDARGMEDHAAYYLRVSELETSIDNYKSTTINVSDILNAAARPGNPKKCVVSTLLLREVIEDHKTTSDNTYVPNVRVITSVTGPADAASLTYWTSGSLPGVIGEGAFSALRAIVLTNEQDIRNLNSTNSTSLASDNPLKGKAADFDHTHTLEEIDSYGQVAGIDSKVNSILATYVTRDMLKDSEGWELELSKVGIYPEANDGTKEVEETVVVDGVETTVTRIEVVDLNQRTRQGHSIYKVATEDGLVGLPSEITNLKSETANLATTKSNLIVDVQVTENTMHEQDTDIVSHPGATTRAITQRLVTSTDGVVSTGYVGENVHDNRAQTFFRTGHAYGYSGYIGSIASLMGVSPKELTEMTNEEIVDAFYDLHPDGYDFSYFRATHGEKLRWNGTKDANIYAPVHVTAFAAGTTYYEYDIGESKHVVTSDTTPDAAKMYYIIVGNKGYSIALGETPADAGEAAVYNRLFSVTDNTSLTVDASSYLCGRFSAYTEVEGAVDPETDKRILGADLVTEAYGTSVLLEKMFRTDTTEITEAVGIPVSNDAVNGSGEYVVAEMDAIFRKGLFYTTEDTTVVKGKRYFSRGMDDGYNEILGLAEGDVIDTTSPYYEVITLEDVFNARSAAEELTTTGSINVKTLVDAGAARIVYDFDEQGRLIVWGPWDQLATKHYVDKKLENVSVEGGSGFGGGVIDGVLCKDADGNDVITKVSAKEWASSIKNDKYTYEYEVKNDCLLNIQFNADVTDFSPEGARVYVGDTRLRTCVDIEDSFTESINIPVKCGTIVKLISDLRPYLNINEVNSTRVEEDYAILFQEFRLNSLNVTVGLPNYDKGEDIKSKVVRTVLNTPKGYKAPSDGFVLFDFIVPLYTAPYQVSWSTLATAYVNGIRVFAARTDYKNASYNQDAGLIPVRKGDTIDWNITSNNGTSTWIQDVSSWTEVKCTFFPLVGAGESTSGPIEYAIAECPFTLTGTTNPFLPGSTVPSLDKRTLDPGSIKSRTGRDVNLKEATIKFRMDVFLPKRNADGSITIDANGYTVPDDSKPMFSNDTYGQFAYSSNSFYTKPFELVEVNGKTVIKWNVQLHSQLWLPSLLTINPSSGSLPVVDYTATEGNGTNIDPKYNILQGKAASLGLSNYYIRLTAVIDPNRKNVIESKSGMFVTGDIAKDENGKVCKTLVPYTEWAAKQDSDGKYVYEYTVKTDCWLHADYLVHAAADLNDEVVVTINGEVLSANAENSFSGGQVSTYSNFISMPVKRGTKIGFHSVARPNHNWFSNVGSAASEILKEPRYAIKILEFKMGTELNPAQFPSLAVRVLDCDMAEVDSNLGKTYTWTESELRQIFGPMYSVDESRIEFSTTFYKATSAEGFDDATVKMTDTRDLLQNTAAYLKFPVTISKNDVGENIISVYVPSKGEMLTPVSWDATNSKFIMNPGVLELQNSDMPVGTRMRLNMHISDRRGDMPDELLPNGISPNSKMVRQGDMTFSPTVTEYGVQRTYSNEITITESGYCFIVANIDNDGNASGVNNYTVVVQALIGASWTTIAAQSKDTLDANGGRGIWNFSFPVEAGLKIRMVTNFTHNDASSGINTNWSGSSSDLINGFSKNKQALCWVIPTGKYQNPELNRPGSAGVIDGSIWKDKDGNDLITNITPTSSVTEITYNVKNDCYLMIALYNTDIGDGGTNDGRECIDIVVNGAVVGCLNESNQSSDGVESTVCGINVAEGSVVKLLHHHNYGTNKYKLFGVIKSGGTNPKLNGLLTFTEFKLRATNVLAAMPDWDESKAVAVTDGWVAQADGYLVVRPKSSSTDGSSINVNGVYVGYIRYSDTLSSVNYPSQILVSKGDVITFGNFSVVSDATFYPVKMTRAEYPDKMIVPNWSGDGTVIASGGSVPSDGWIRCYSDPAGNNTSLTRIVSVNGVLVARFQQWDADSTDSMDFQPAVVPVAKNDVVTHSCSVTFFPAKPATTTASEADVLEKKINKNAADIASNASEIETLKSTLSSMDNTAAILNAVYPVGSVYISVSGTLPAPIAAIGTWVQMATGKTLWNVDPSGAIKPGATIDAGLPNITGSTGVPSETATGAFIRGDAIERLEPFEGEQFSELKIDASASNEIYGKSDTVQPPAIAVTMWQRTA